MVRAYVTYAAIVVGLGMFLLAAAAVVSLASCGGGSSPAPAPAAPQSQSPVPTIANPFSYLVQTDAAGNLVTASAPLMTRKHDWPAPIGYQISDSALSDDGTKVIQTFSFSPFGPFNAANGDGGQVAVIGADGFVRFTQTQDGGTPTMQYFVGQDCPGGTGWIVFGTDAPTGSWKGVVAELNDEATGACPPSLNAAYTQYRQEQVTFPLIVNGAVQSLALPTIISEHYDAASIGAAQHMERSYFTRGYGLTRWEAWGLTAPMVDLSARCPAVPVFGVAPAAGWQLDDCRTWTNLVSADGSMTVDAFDWVK